MASVVALRKDQSRQRDGRTQKGPPLAGRRSRQCVGKRVMPTCLDWEKKLRLRNVASTKNNTVLYPPFYPLVEIFGHYLERM
jgi:hypothetical protein